MFGEIEPNTEAGLISNTVKELSKRPPFKEMIYIPSESIKKIQPILLANFCRGIEDRELIKIFKTKRKLVGALRQYFLEVSSLFAYDWKFGKKGFMCANPGINVMLRILRRILIHKNKKMPSKNEISRLLEPISIYFKKNIIEKINQMSVS